jgi:hypothetical protein
MNPPTHPVTQSPSHPLTQSPNHPVCAACSWWSYPLLFGTNNLQQQRHVEVLTSLTVTVRNTVLWSCDMWHHAAWSKLTDTVWEHVASILICGIMQHGASSPTLYRNMLPPSWYVASCSVEQAHRHCTLYRNMLPPSWYVASCSVEQAHRHCIGTCCLHLDM